MAKILGRSSITALTGTLGLGRISSSISGLVNLQGGAAGGFSAADEAQFDKFKWFDIEFYEENEALSSFFEMSRKNVTDKWRREDLRIDIRISVGDMDCMPGWT